jgi:hypothetical protein
VCHLSLNFPFFGLGPSFKGLGTFQRKVELGLNLKLWFELQVEPKFGFFFHLSLNERKKTKKMKENKKQKALPLR